MLDYELAAGATKRETQLLVLKEPAQGARYRASIAWRCKQSVQALNRDLTIARNVACNDGALACRCLEKGLWQALSTI